MSETEIDAIRELPRFRDSACQACGSPMRVHALQIYARCAKCGAEQKHRAFGGIGTETQDVIDAVLAWAGIPREEVIRRHEEAFSGNAKRSR